MPDPVTDPTASAALTPNSPPPAHDEWVPQPFPGVNGEKQLRTAFWILNEWAKALKEWQFRSAALSAITQVTLNMDDDQVDEVVTEMKGKHDIKKIKDLLDKKNNRHTPVLGFPTDVLGHPPGPPYDEQTLPDPNKT
jgi:hypothetical protein